MDIDPAFEPATPVLALMGCCDANDAARAREWIASELLNDVERSAEGWDPWWDDLRARLSDIDFEVWPMVKFGRRRSLLSSASHTTDGSLPG